MNALTKRKHPHFFRELYKRIATQEVGRKINKEKAGAER